ncbi:MAG: protein phosphatase 2C domain-containing protein [Tannerella sp.]|jgi:protein phosphatase|nr:protein phosphatase 2C domain-containing protein [Tannerella sp.]
MIQIRLNQPYALNETGGGSNPNEDTIFPACGKATVRNAFFLVCDGIGGHQNGEVASQSVCRSFAGFLQPVRPDDFDEDVFRQALEQAYEQLDEKDAAPDGGKKMGTTLTFLYLNCRGALMAHIGDSRIYHLRRENGEMAIRYKSRDHSLVNDLLQADIITPEEAVHHPKRNVITRAMQPHQTSRSKADIRQTDDVKAGDYFFLCSDGIPEQISDSTLCDILAKDTDDKAKIGEIHRACRGRSKDNFSAYLIPVAEAVAEETLPETTGDDTEATLLAGEEPDILLGGQPVQHRKQSGKWKWGIVSFLLIVLLACGAYWWGTLQSGNGGKQPIKRVENAPAPSPSSETQKWMAEYDRFLKRADNYCKQGNYQMAKNAYSQALSVVPGSDRSGKRTHVVKQIKVCDGKLKEEKETPVLPEEKNDADTDSTDQTITNP